MGIIGGSLGYKVLRRIGQPSGEGSEPGDSCSDGSKLERMFGPRVWDEIRGNVVIDFGCGLGSEAIEIAEHDAGRVIGLDIREKVLARARKAALDAGVKDRCVFTTTTDELADVIISLDAFEHFEEPEEVLRLMRRLVKPSGAALIAFGPTWYHPLGGHLFSIFPWSHLIFTESVLIRWRQDFRDDGAMSFKQVEGGLNQMTIRYFEEIVSRSDFQIVEFEAVPIRWFRGLARGLTREFFTAFVRCRLIPR